MNVEVLLGVFDTVNLSVATYGVAVAFAVLATLVPDRATAVRLSLSDISPLWLMVPVGVSAVLLASGRSKYLARTAAGETVPILVLAQIVISIWVVWGYRRFPWLVFPLAVVAGWIQWSFFLTGSVQG